MPALTIKIVSDVSCPWCIIGYKSLTHALKNLGESVSADISWLPFELNPNMPIEGQDMGEHIQEKYGATPEQSAANREHIQKTGAALGFSFHPVSRIYNTFDAHRLLHWAASENRQTDLKLALFDLYFSHAGNPSHKQQLLDAVTRAGLDKEQARTILESGQYTQEVRDLQQYSHQNGINSVPAFIINDKYMINGGQAVESFEKALRDISQKETDITHPTSTQES